MRKGRVEMKLEFCKICDCDLEMMRLWRMKPEVTKYMYTDPDISPADQVRWYEDICSNEGCKNWLISVDGNKIGLVCLFDIDALNKRAGWGYYIASEDARGKGVGKCVELNIMEYVFDVMEFNKLWCEVLRQNDIVIKIHEKYGSKVEGVRREHIFKHGEYRDVVEMGIVKKEWEMIKNSFCYDKAIIY